METKATRHKSKHRKTHRSMWMLRVVLIGYVLIALLRTINAQDEAGGGGAAGDGGGAAGGGEGGAGGGEGGAGGGEGGAGGGEGGAGGGEGGAGDEKGVVDSREGGPGGGGAGAGSGAGGAGGGAAGGDGAGKLPQINPDETGTDKLYDFSGLGTTHEQMGQGHWPELEYTDFKSKVVYTEPLKYPQMGLNPIFNFTHYLFDNTLTNDPSLPRGFIVLKEEDTLFFGPKVEMNDWRDLLWEYWLYMLWTVFLVFLIIIIPFIGVCYCCFCCCRRCAVGCAPCTKHQERRRRLICGSLLFLFTFLILVGTIIAIMSNYMIDNGLKESAHTIRRSSDDTCRFLKDATDHIYHLLGHNYEEILNHLIDLLHNANTHIFLDLGDTSEANSIEEMERILDNIPTAKKLMNEVNSLEKELRYASAQLRDGVRGVKREVTVHCAINQHWRCTRFLKQSSIQFIDATKCLHLDQLPKTTKYLDGLVEIIDKKLGRIPKNALLRLQDVKNKIKEELDKVAPSIINEINAGREKFLYHADHIRKIVESTINDIHFSTLRLSRSFEDVYDKFSADRYLINMVICVIFVVLIVSLLVALICGCYGNMAFAAASLLFSLVLIFCAFSFIILVGLFYFFVGLVAYGGACSPIVSHAGAKFLHQVVDTNSKLLEPEVKMWTALKLCRRDQTIFQVLRKKKIYDVDELGQVEVLRPESLQLSEMQHDFSKLALLTQEEKHRLFDLTTANLSTYHSVLYIENLCRTLTPTTLPAVAKELRSISDNMYTNWGGYLSTRVAYSNNALHLDTYHNEWVIKIHSIQQQIKQKLAKIDDLILYNNNNFGKSIDILLKSIMRSEAFVQSRGKMFIRELIVNLTSYCDEHMDLYVSMVVNKFNLEVGRCEPLAYTYYRGLEHICGRLIDPINSFWVGVLFSGLLLLPLLFVIHRLMCLYKVYTPTRRRHRNVTASGFEHLCPICTGAPYVPPPLTTCTGGQQIAKGSKRSPGGATDNSTFIVLTEPQPNESCVEFLPELTALQPASKRKQD